MPCDLGAADAIALSRVRDSIVHIYGSDKIHAALDAACQDWRQAGTGPREYRGADWCVRVYDKPSVAV